MYKQALILLVRNKYLVFHILCDVINNAWAAK